MGRKRYRTISGVAAVLALLLGVGSLVVGAPVQARAEAAQTTRERHCTVQIKPLADGQRASTVSGFTCFDSFAAAVASATDGAVQLPTNATPDDFTEPPVGVQTTRTVIGIDFQSSWFRGSSLTWYSPAGGCTNTRSFAAAKLPSSWTEGADSARAYGNCDDFVHYQLNNLQRARFSCTCSSMGGQQWDEVKLTWNNRPQF